MHRGGRRLAGLLLTGGLALACSNKAAPPDGGTTGTACAGQPQCSGNDISACPSQTNYTCQGGCCVFFCRAASDCAGQSCAQSALGCVCDLGVCQQKVCSADADCGSGKVCKAGACQSPDPSALSCVITPPLFVAHVGGSVHLNVAAFGPDGGTARVGAAPTFTVSDGQGRVDAEGNFTDSHPSTSSADVTLTATLGGATCVAAATVYGPAARPQLTVIDGNTLLPVRDATVLVSSPSTGQTVGAAVASGDGLGRYDLTGLALAGNLLNAFHSRYQYQSVLLPSSGLAATPDLVMVLAQTSPFDMATRAPFTGGYSGDFRQGAGPFSPASQANEAADLVFAIAGTSVPEDPAEVSLSTLLGPTVSVAISGGQMIPVPVGTELALGGSPLTCGYQGLGIAGGCGLAVLDGGQDPFLCAAKAAWGLGGPIPSGPIESAILSGGAPTVGELLTLAAPSFPAFSSAVGFEVGYQLAAPQPASAVPSSCNPSKTGSGSQPLPDPAKLAPYQLNLDTPVALVANLTLPALPSLGGACVQQALVLGGSLQLAQGLLPLGISSASTLNAAGMPDAQCLTYDPQSPATPTGQLALHLAPAHGGMEGARYGLVALAGLGAATQAVSGLVQTFDALPYDTAVNFNGQAFPSFAEGASYTLANRTFAIGSVAQTPTLYRLRFIDTDSRGNGPGSEWVIALPPSTPSVMLPLPPSPYEDRTVGVLLASAPFTQVEALQLQSSDSANALIDFSSGAAALDLLDHVTAFSTLQITAK